MNVGGPIARPVTLSLATRDAVSRVIARHRNRSSVYAGWSRLVLRWRRRGPRPTRAAAGRTTIATHAYWFPQFHLYFNELTTRLASRAVSDAPRLAAVDDARPQFRHRDVTFTRVKGVASMPSRRLHPAAHALVTGRVRSSRTQPAPTDEPRRVRRLHRSERPRDRVRGETGRPGADTGIPRNGALLDGHRHTKGAATSKWVAILRPPGQRGMLPRVERRPAQAYRRASRDQAALVALLRSMPWREAPASRRSRRPADVSLPGPAAMAPRVPQGPADLTWRSSPRAAAVVADRNAQAAGHVPPRPVPAAVQSITNPSTVEARKDRPAVLSAASVDPRLLDRLTDDVIRQVERRIRVDRERRGL